MNIKWVTKHETNFIIGNISAGKSVFLMRCAWETTAPTDPLMISAKTNQAAIPAVNHTTNGTLCAGCALKPTLKTNQKIKIMTIG